MKTAELLIGRTPKGAGGAMPKEDAEGELVGWEGEAMGSCHGEPPCELVKIRDLATPGGQVDSLGPSDA